MISDSVLEYWKRFCQTASGVTFDTPYQVWYFGNSPKMAAELVDLVIAGKKTATASLAATNELEPENAPVLGGYSVVTDFDGLPKCIVQTTAIEHRRFSEVDCEFAAAEGEGDLSLEYWRRVHREYYTLEAAAKGISLDDDPLVCCERFRLLYSE